MNIYVSFFINTVCSFCFLAILSMGTADAQVSFGDQNEFTESGEGPYVVLVEELDGIGGPDVVVANRLEDQIVYYRNLGEGDFISALSVSQKFSTDIYEMVSGDFSGNGAIDIISASDRQNAELEIFENDGSGNFANFGLTYQGTDPKSLDTGDINGDGKIDLLYIASGAGIGSSQIVWIESVGRGLESEVHIVETKNPGASLAILLDRDNDGDQDIIAYYPQENDIILFTNDGDGNFELVENMGIKEFLLNENVPGVTKFVKGDFLGDGDNELGLVVNGNIGFMPFFVNVITLYDSFDDITNFEVADMNNDGFSDIVFTSFDQKGAFWLQSKQQVEGRKSYTEAKPINTSLEGPIGIATGDLDEDGLPDVVVTDFTGNITSWYKNDTDREISFVKQNPVITNAVTQPDHMVYTDLNGDEIEDLLVGSSSSTELSFFIRGENGTFGEKQMISNTAGTIEEVKVADLDGDGFPDVIVASSTDPNVSVYMNSGTGSFGTGMVLTNEADPRDLALADIDEDGDMDLFVPDFGGGGILRFINSGDGTFSLEAERYVDWATEIVELEMGSLTSQIGERVDMIISDLTRGTELYKGFQSFGSATKLSENATSNILLRDLTFDNSYDAVYTTDETPKVGWFRKPGNNSNVAPFTINEPGSAPVSLATGDIDSDGIEDFIYSTSDNQIYWQNNFANFDFSNEGNFSEQKNITGETSGLNNPGAIIPADLDDDGDIDILVASTGSNEILWLKNLDIESSDTGTSIVDEEAIPQTFSLLQNYPNPFNPSTVISFNLPQSHLVTLKVYNFIGQEVASLAENTFTAGSHSLQFQANNLASGVYFYRLTAGGQSITKKMLLIK
jgi:hypothetical protein